MRNITYGYRVSGSGYRGRIGSALVSSVALMTAACGGGEHAVEVVAARDPITVQVQAVTKAPRAAMVEAGGLVQAKTTAVVTSRLMAPVREVRVAPGDQVRAGQVLVVLDDRDLGAQARSAQSAALAAEQSVTAGGADRQAAEAGLALAKASHARVSLLHGRKSATSQELDEATASLRAAEARVAAIDARVQQAQAALGSARAGSEAATVTAGFAVITAPFTGVVTEKLVEPGNMATPRFAAGAARGAWGLAPRRPRGRLAGHRRGDRTGGRRGPRCGRAAVAPRHRERSGSRHGCRRPRLPREDRPALRRAFALGHVRSRALPGADVRGLAGARRLRSSVVGRSRRCSSRTATRLACAWWSSGGPSTRAIEVVSGLSEGERIVTTPPAALADGAPIRTGAK